MLNKSKNFNSNYCATIVKVHHLIDLPGLDNLQGLCLFNDQALVSKDIKVGDLGVLFTANTQLDSNFCYHNNLFRNSELNIDKNQSGYLDDNARIRALKLRKHTSTALFLPISCFSYLGEVEFKEGDSFDFIGDKEICRKYYIKPPREHNNQPKKIKEYLIDPKIFPEYGSTDSYFKNKGLLIDSNWITATIKLHGTSARFCNHKTPRKLSRVERLLKWFGFKIQEYEYKVWAGSRTVVKGNNDGGYYDHDVWNENLLKIHHLIPKDWVIYGEIIGWAGHSPIQKGYTYGIPEGQNRFLVYKISVINEDGVRTDLSWNNIKSWCNSVGLEHVVEVFKGWHKDFNVSEWMDRRYGESGLTKYLPDDKNPDEGLVVRLEGTTPLVLKCKCQSFILKESAMMDTGEVDMESDN